MRAADLMDILRRCGRNRALAAEELLRATASMTLPDIEDAIRVATRLGALDASAATELIAQLERTPGASSELDSLHDRVAELEQKAGALLVTDPKGVSLVRAGAALRESLAQADADIAELRERIELMTSQERVISERLKERLP